MRQVVGHVRTIDRAGDGRCDIGVVLPITIRHPYHERYLILVTATIGRKRRIVQAAVAVRVVEHLLAMVGEVDDDGVALAETIENLAYDTIVVARGVVVVGYDPAFIPIA